MKVDDMGGESFGDFNYRAMQCRTNVSSPMRFSCSPVRLFVVPLRQVMISNLDYSLTEEDVKVFCSAAGPVTAVKLIKKRYAKTSKG